MSTPRYYRPKRKDDLIRHLEEYHPPAKTAMAGGAERPRFYRQAGWTMSSLTEHHDDLHADRIVTEDEGADRYGQS